MLICLLSKQIFSNLLKIRRSSFSKSACLFLRSENRMNKSNTKRHSPKVNAKKEFACIPSHAKRTEKIYYTYNIYNALYTTDILHKLEYASDMQSEINDTRNSTNK